jgi:DNA replication protein DnaC
MTTPKNTSPMTCPSCNNTGCTPVAVHYTGLGDSPVSYCKECPLGRELLQDWSGLPAQRAYAGRIREDQVRRALRLSCMRTQFAGQRLADLNAQPSLCRPCTRYVQQWPAMLEQGRGLYFWGPLGSGKTHAATVVVNELIDRHLVETLFLNFPEAVARFRQAIGDPDNSDADTLLERMKRVELLVLDDLGIEKPSAWVTDLLYGVVDERWRERRPMLVTSVLSPAGLALHYSPQIASRMGGCCEPLWLTGEDRRQAR